jgi:hypothetical protein
MIWNESQIYIKLKTFIEQYKKFYFQEDFFTMTYFEKRSYNHIFT